MMSSPPALPPERGGSPRPSAAEYLEPGGPRDPGHPFSSPAVVVRTVPMPGPSMPADRSLLELLPHDVPHDEVVSWVRRGDGLVGWGTALSFEARGPERFAAAEAWWQQVGATAVVRDEVSAPGSGLVCFGTFPLR